MPTDVALWQCRFLTSMPHMGRRLLLLSCATHLGGGVGEALDVARAHHLAVLRRRRKRRLVGVLEAQKEKRQRRKQSNGVKETCTATCTGLPAPEPHRYGLAKQAAACFERAQIENHNKFVP